MECILNLVDPLFDQGHTEKYRLSILLRPDGFSFCVLDPRTMTFVALADYTLGIRNSSAIPRNEKLCELFKQEMNKIDLFQLAFNKIDLVYASPKATLIPPGFVHETSLESYFRFNHQLDAAEIVATQFLEIGNIQVAYALPSCIRNLCISRFSVLQPGSTATALIQSLLRSNDHIIARQVFLNVMGGFFDVIIIQGRKLLYYNTFKRSAPDDLVYFTIYVLEQMGFVPSEEIVNLMGDIIAGDEDFKMLYHYIDRLNFANFGVQADFGTVFSDIPVHKYFTLFNLPFCE
ncbi:MAG: DUF3822 family protein [Bacteroidales bacterium]|nr:DUF3822 family protein [Bacteroidales bacterium]